MWFQFSQNNSGGHFYVNEKVCHRLFIEAYNYDKAEKIAKELGVYFDGVNEGMDCSCCGDRWNSGHEIRLPINYSKGQIFHSVEAYAQFLANQYGWTIPDARLFYRGGQTIEINKL